MDTGHILGTVVVYALAINVGAFALFGWDKACARNGSWRVPESTLLGIAFLGGSPGAKLGQRFFRHKTRKQPFGTSLNLIIVVQLCAIAALSIPQVRQAAWEIAAVFLAAG